MRGREPNTPARPRVLLVLREYPQRSESYIQSEIDALQPDFDLAVLTRRAAGSPSRRAAPYEVRKQSGAILERVREFRPRVLHSHWLHSVALLHGLARKTGVPFTVRAHSFDVLAPGGAGRVPSMLLEECAPALADELCLGVLTFPFTRPLFEQVGVPADKVVDCFPVVALRRFHDRSPNGDAVINTGACLPKKGLSDYLALARQLPGVEFHLWPIGYEREALLEENRRLGEPVAIHAEVEHDEMPAIYKRHRWLVYTACRALGTVGWPLAVAEAQAAGVGVCMANLRPDLRDYAGPGAVLFDSLEELVDVVRGPVPDEVREAGFEQARLSDVERHVHRLTERWRPVLG
jgi:hypothetical protein